MYSMPICGSITDVLDQKTFEHFFIHEFYPKEPKSVLSKLTLKQQTCLKEYANEFKKTPISNIKKDPKKTAILKLLIRVGRKKIEKHMIPKPISEVESSSLARASSAETGFASEVPLETLAEIPSKQRSKIKKIMRHKPYSSTTKIRQENSPETGFASVPKREPTVDEFLEDTYVYPEWIKSINKSGGATRRKKSRARKTRRYL